MMRSEPDPRCKLCAVITSPNLGPKRTEEKQEVTKDSLEVQLSSPVAQEREAQAGI